MKDFWNSRYSQTEYIYGKEPNEFLKIELQKVKPGKILFIGEGEGRNAVYAAKLGWEVDAVDFSEEAKNKALQLAKENNVIINYTTKDLADFTPKTNYYDAAGIFYLHLNEDLRKSVNKKIIEALKPNGKVILEVFEKEQIKYNSGGPKDESLLYSLEDITEDFIELDFEIFAKEKISLNEGSAHQGEAVVIRFVGIKPLFPDIHI
ncbi:class I SAM-dependent methyltransferase [Rosettibacter firmus]|uniref:class I SAM-dependent methyltransferase n=1 Tax=Rosettibacter firmus TaxID=3111522 RepID=UPI00336BE433